MHYEEFNRTIKLAQDFKNYFKTKINITGTTDKSINYMSDVIFASVVCETQNGERKVKDVVIKQGSKSSLIRSIFHTNTVFQQEILLYSIIFPSYLDFQKEREVREVFNPLPKFYISSAEEKEEFIILANLKFNGYQIHSRKEAFSRKHTEICLKEYAKLHALSFAMRHQNKSRFDQLMAMLNGEIYAKHFQGRNIDLNTVLFDQIVQLLKRKGMSALNKKLEELLSLGNPAERSVELLLEKTNYNVLIHGDAWLNNLLFFYEDEEKTSPTKLAIIDWQLTSVCNSPIYDLSFILYTCASADDLEKLKELLDIYYNALSEFIRELGSDPDILFPYEDFLNHWRRYRLLAFMTVPLIMKFLYCQNEDVKYENATNLDEFVAWIINVKIEDKDYEDRLIGICQRFLNDNI